MRIDGYSAVYSTTAFSVGGRKLASTSSGAFSAFSAEFPDPAAVLELSGASDLSTEPLTGASAEAVPALASQFPPPPFLPVGTLTADQRATTTQTPPPEFYSQFQAAFQKLAEAWQAASEQNAADPTLDADVRDGLVNTVGLQHVEWTERAFQFSQQHEQDKSEFYSVKTTVEFASILNQAYDTVPEGSAREFLLTLSVEELHVVQVQHALADPISPGRLSEEGALNLLLPHGFAVDPNHDGLLETGVSKGLTFPPLDAPQSVRDAWLAVTKELSEMDIATHQLSLWGSLQGQSLPTTEPSSYTTVAQQYLDMLESFRGFLAPEQYERDQPFYSSFLNELVDRSAEVS